jgi:hypothetical protein
MGSHALHDVCTITSSLFVAHSSCLSFSRAQLLIWAVPNENALRMQYLLMLCHFAAALLSLGCPREA